jgi:hypothetical protein
VRQNSSDNKQRKQLFLGRHPWKVSQRSRTRVCVFEGLETNNLATTISPLCGGLLQLNITKYSSPQPENPFYRFPTIFKYRDFASDICKYIYILYISGTREKITHTHDNRTTNRNNTHMLNIKRESSFWTTFTSNCRFIFLSKSNSGWIKARNRSWLELECFFQLFSI